MGRLVEVLDRAGAGIDELDRAEVRDRTEVLGQGSDEGRREHDLAAVAGRRDPCRVVHVDPDVVLRLAGPTGTEPTLAEMKAHPDADIAAGSPDFSRDRALGVGRGHDRRVGPIEGREERVALGLDHGAAVALDGVAQQDVVAPDDLGPRKRADGALGARRTLDVGEQERDRGASRQRHGTTASSQYVRGPSRSIV